MQWGAFPGLAGVRARCCALLAEGGVAAQDRLALARLEWAQHRRALACLALLALVFAVTLLAALLLAAYAVLLQFWDTPARQLVAWLLALGALLLAALLLLLARRVLGALARPFALTRQELARDWGAVHEACRPPGPGEGRGEGGP